MILANLYFGLYFSLYAGHAGHAGASHIWAHLGTAGMWEGWKEFGLGNGMRKEKQWETKQEYPMSTV